MVLTVPFEYFSVFFPELYSDFLRRYSFSNFLGSGYFVTVVRILPKLFRVIVWRDDDSFSFISS